MKPKLGPCRTCQKRGAKVAQDANGTFRIVCPHCPHAISNSKTASSAARLWNTGKCADSELCGCPF